MRGRKPIPTKLKLLNGNPGKRPLNKNEPQPKRQRPSCPRWLSKEAQAEWRRVVPVLDRLGLLTALDRAALVGYCESYGEYERCRKYINRRGRAYIRRDENGKVKYRREQPEVRIAQKALGDIHKSCALFGLSPSDRGRMSIPGKAEPEDEMEHLLSRIGRR